MTERDAAQAFLDKKFPGYMVIPEEEGTFIPKRKAKTILNYLSNEIKGVKLSKNKSEEYNHITRVSTTRLLIGLLGLYSDGEVSAIVSKASVKLSDEDKSFERAVIACQEYMTACSASPEVLLEGLKAELVGE